MFQNIRKDLIHVFCTPQYMFAQYITLTYEFLLNVFTLMIGNAEQKH